MASPILEWIEDYRIGVDSLDYEHQDLFQRINELHAELTRHDDKAMVESCLGEIHARLESHFALEERFMREHKHAAYAGHKAEHDRFLDDFVGLMAAFAGDPGQALGPRLATLLSTWIVRHLTTHDRALALAWKGRPGKGR